MKKTSLLVALLLLVALAACSPDSPQIVGTWRNGTNQILSVTSSLTARLSQTSTCSPVLDVKVHRDAFDNYALIFTPGQLVVIPPAQRPLFPDFDFYCSSAESVPMCRFCVIEGNRMSCESPEQGISGAGASVVHDCTWSLLSASTSTVTPPGDNCPATVDSRCPTL